jgi:hypothetical protein
MGKFNAKNYKFQLNKGLINKSEEKVTEDKNSYYTEQPPSLRTEGVPSTQRRQRPRPCWRGCSVGTVREVAVMSHG